MTQTRPSSKSTFIPCNGAVEIGDLLPIVEHPLFQRLRRCRQLGLNDLIFPGAQHTRFEHALGVLARTRFAAQLQHMDSDSTRRLEVFALLHDIGHGPFSHQIEPALQKNHHERGKECISEMAAAIHSCGVSSEDVISMLNGKDPLAFWVSDRNLGTDKLDYLERDAYHIGFAGGPSIETIQRQTIIAPDVGGLALKEKFIEEGKRLQKFYSYLHQHGYLNKTALAAQRMLQRAIQEELLLCDNPAALSEKLWPMTDDELMQWLHRAKSALARRYCTALANRSLYRTCLCIKPDGYGYVENTVDKPIALLEWPRQRLSRLSNALATLPKLRQIEDELATAAGLPPGALLLAAMPYFTKLLPKDLRIANGGDNDYWLFEKDKDHRASLESDYLRTFAVRLTVPEAHRTRLSKSPAPLLEVLEAHTANSGN
ncbi:MAG: HD domain-containing protein [Lentisphaeria bacterium]|nr:HD domain-containing protein [Lentisphaeria bacterium]